MTEKIYTAREICGITGLSYGTIRKGIIDTHPKTFGKKGGGFLYGQDFLEYLQSNCVPRGSRVHQVYVTIEDFEEFKSKTTETIRVLATELQQLKKTKT